MQAQAMTGKKSIIYIRAILTLCILVLAANNYKEIMASRQYVIFYIIALLATNAASFYIPEKSYDGLQLHYFIFLLDIIIVSLGAYWLAHLDFQFFMIIFLTIFISAISQSVKLSLVIALVVNCIYLYMKAMTIEGGAASLWEERILLNIPFLFIVALHASYLAERAGKEEASLKRLERSKKDLSDKVKTMDGEMSVYAKFTGRVYESFREGVIVLDSYGVIKVFTSKCEGIFNMKRGRAVNSLYREVKGLEQLAEIITDLKLKKIPALDREVFLDVEGTRKKVIVNTAFIKDDADATAGILCVLRQINDSIRMDSI